MLGYPNFIHSRRRAKQGNNQFSHFNSAASICCPMIGPHSYLGVLSAHFSKTGSIDATVRHWMIFCAEEMRDRCGFFNCNASFLCVVRTTQPHATETEANEKVWYTKHIYIIICESIIWTYLYPSALYSCGERTFSVAIVCARVL